MSRRKQQDPWLILAVGVFALAVIIVLASLGIEPK